MHAECCQFTTCCNPMVGRPNNCITSHHTGVSMHFCVAGPGQPLAGCDGGRCSSAAHVAEVRCLDGHARPGHQDMRAAADRSGAGQRVCVSQHLCLPCVQGAELSQQSSQNSSLWTCPVQSEHSQDCQEQHKGLQMSLLPPGVHSKLLQGAAFPCLVTCTIQYASRFLVVKN